MNKSATTAGKICHLEGQARSVFLELCETAAR